MWERLKELWKTFSETYGPAIVGGVFLCVADLLQSGANGQLCKLGRVIGDSAFWNWLRPVRA